MKNKDEQINVVYWFLLGILVGLIILAIVLAISGKAPLQLEEEIQNLEQELQSCQEKVPFWTLEVKCYYPDINYYNMELFGYNVIGNQDISLELQNYKDYFSALQFAESDKYCEVIK